MCVSISSSERGHKIHKFIKNKWRNKLDSDKLSKLLSAHSSLRSKVKHAAELEKLAHHGDEALLKATKAITTFWEEEEMSGGKVGSTIDWGSRRAPAPHMAAPMLNCWTDATEATMLKQGSSQSQSYFHTKYVSTTFPLMLKIREEVDDDEIPGIEHRCIIGVAFSNTKQRKGWEVVTNLCIVTENEDGSISNVGHPIPRPTDTEDGIVVADQRERYPIDSKLHRWIIDSNLNDSWVINTIPT